MNFGFNPLKRPTQKIKLPTSGPTVPIMDPKNTAMPIPGSIDTGVSPSSINTPGMKTNAALSGAFGATARNPFAGLPGLASAAGVMGGKPVAPTPVAMPEPTMNANVITTPTQQQPTPVAMPKPIPPKLEIGPQTDSSDKQAINLSGKALNMIGEGLNNGTEATQSQISRGREAVASKARSDQAQAGGAVAKSGSIGQGEASNQGQQVRANTLAQIGENERSNSQLVSNERQDLARTAMNMGESAKNREVTKTSEYNSNKRFYDQMDVNKGENFSRGLLDMASQMNNPVLNNKIMEWQMRGGQGALGEFSANEKQQMQKYINDNADMDSQLKTALVKMMGGLSDSTAKSVDAAGNPVTMNANTPDATQQAPGQRVQRASAMDGINDAVGMAKNLGSDIYRQSGNVVDGTGRRLKNVGKSALDFIGF